MFSRLLNIGVKEDQEFYLRREIRILNLFALIILFGLMIGATNVFFLGEVYPALIEAVIALLSSSIFFLNAWQKNEWAAYMFVLTMNGAIFFVGQYYDDSVAGYLYFFPLVFCVALLHNPNRSNARTLLFFSIILINFFATRLLDVESIHSKPIPPEQNHILFLYNVFFCVIITIVLVYMVIRLINNINAELFDKLVKVNESERQLTQSVKEKEILLSEVQHRVKNNLAVIMGLLNFQVDKATSEESKMLLQEAKNRTMSIAMVHERLYKRKDFSRIDFSQYLSELVKEVVHGHELSTRINVIEDIEETEVDISKAIPAGLIVNELITNSLKHAFDRSHICPEIKISISQSLDKISVTIADNGKGFDRENHQKSNTLGMDLIESLTEQIEGKVNFKKNEGTQVNVQFTV